MAWEDILFAFGIVSAVVYLVVVTLLNQHVRFRHPEIWDNLGRPTFWNNSPANNIRFFKFCLVGSSYRRLGDPVLNKYVFVARTLCLFVMIYFLIGIFVVFGDKSS
ncbi:MAG TPA: hypothetical protein VIJ72_04940 [Rhizomicrobium sp.]